MFARIATAFGLRDPERAPLVRKSIRDVIRDMQEETLKQVLRDKPGVFSKSLVYDPRYLCSWSVFLCRYGTVFNDAKLKYITAALYVVALFTASIVYAIVPRPQDLDTSAVFEIVTYFKVFIAFMLGLFMNSCLNRWWSCMVSLTDCFLTVKKMNFLLSVCAIPAEQRDAVQRLSILSCYLLENEVTSIWVNEHHERQRRWLRVVKFLTEEGLVLDHEIHSLEDEVEHDDRAARVWVWIGAHFMAFDAKNVSAPIRGAFLGLVTEATNEINDIKNYVEYQLPFMYSHLLAVFVHLNNILIAFACGVAMASNMSDVVNGWRNHESGRVARAAQSMIGQLFVLTIQPLIYQAFLEIAATLCDPFTHRVYGMPLVTAIKELRDQMKSTNELGSMDLDQLEKDYAETKKEKMARIMKKHSLAGTLASLKKDSGQKMEP